MAIRYDMHMHSSFSTDSDAPMQSMVETAAGLGLQGICFTEHMDLDYPDGYFPEDAKAFTSDPEAVNKEILRLRQSLSKSGVSSSLWIGFGLEFGMQPHLAGTFHEIAVNSPLDFIVASQHLVDSLDPYYPASWAEKDPEIVIGNYYQEMLSNLKKMREWDTLAHMDYIIRYLPDRGSLVYDSMTIHSDIIDEILRYVILEGKCLEVNTSGYKYGLGQPNPAPSILKRYRELGGELITIGSDAHAPGQIAFAYDEVCHLLLNLGFHSYCVFEKRRMREIQLSSISS